MSDNASQKGHMKFDDGKPPMQTMVLDYFPHALAAIAMVSEYGARKYATGGWKGVENGLERYADAGARHNNLRAIEGEYDDGDSGLSHRAQKAWNALAELELAILTGVVEITRGNVLDDNNKPILDTGGVVFKPREKHKVTWGR